MLNVALGPKSVFRSISSVQRLKELFAKCAPSAEIDWSLRKKDLPDNLVAACKALRTSSQTEYSNLVCALQEICDVCADRKSSTKLFEALRDAKLLQAFLESRNEEHDPSLQSDAVWLMINAPNIWEHLVISANTAKIKAKTIEEYEVLSPQKPDTDKIPQLQSEIASFLKNESLHGEYVHIEMYEECQLFRFLVSVNSFPVNVQQFDVHGKYAVARDSNAINFALEYDASNGSIRLKCPLDAPKRREVVRLFAETLLQTKVKQVERPFYDLSRYLEGCVLPPPGMAALLNARFRGITISYANITGTTDSITLTTEGTTRLDRTLATILDCLKLPKSKIKVTEVFYEITMQTRTGTKNINAKITSDGFHFLCRNGAERAAIKSYLEKIVS